ncbi:MAG: hypothetical protein M0Z93_00720 [Actinomycetota bacterium]|nr:hypothetical protein [Actinomycetota bacterium]
MTAAGVLIPAGAALAATGTSSATTTSGSLSIGTTTPETISVPVAGTGNGILPSAVWADSTGTGAGWNGTVAVSDLSYTGAWVAQGSATALTTATSVAYTGTQDGVEYTVTTGTITSGAGSYTWTSTNTTTGNPTGSGTAVASTANLVGTLGVTINFGTQSLTSGYVYVIKTGTQSASAFTLDTSATGASITPVSGTTSANPAFVGNSTTVSGGGVASSAYGTAVKFVSAALNTGMGSYTVDPGAQVAADASSWAATYTAGVQFSIVTGP